MDDISAAAAPPVPVLVLVPAPSPMMRTQKSLPLRAPIKLQDAFVSLFDRNGYDGHYVSAARFRLGAGFILQPVLYDREVPTALALQ